MCWITSTHVRHHYHASWSSASTQAAILLVSRRRRQTEAHVSTEHQNQFARSPQFSRRKIAAFPNTSFLLRNSADSLATSLPTHCLSAAGNFLHFSPSCNGLARQYRREGRSSTVRTVLGLRRKLATRDVLCYTATELDWTTRRLIDSPTHRLRRLNNPPTRPSAYFATRR